MIRSIAVVLVLVLAGCLFPGDSTDQKNGTTDPKPTQCIGRVCLEDPDTHDAQYALEHFGFYKLTTDGGRILRPQVQDDLLVWQTLNSVEVDRQPGPVDSDILAYDFESGALMEVARSPDHLYKIPYLDGHRVIFTVEPLKSAPEYGEVTSWVAMWDAETNETTRLDLGLSAHMQESRGFDGEWALVAVTGTTNESEIGVWAYNVDTQAKELVYRPWRNGTLPNGTYETLKTSTIANGTVYRALAWSASNPPESEEDVRYFIEARSLPDGNWTRVWEGGVGIQRMGVVGMVMVAHFSAEAEEHFPFYVGNGWIDLQSRKSEMVVATRLNATSSSARPEHMKSDSWIVSWDWDRERRPNPYSLWAYWIPEREARLILGSLALTVEAVAVDDEYLVVGAWRRTEVWESQSSDHDRWNVYWMPIEELERRWHAAGDM